MSALARRTIQVWADWAPLDRPARVGTLYATPARGREVFSFEYDAQWLASGHALALDPRLQLFAGPQYEPEQERENFGVFLDSSPDRWGRMLIRRREERAARKEQRPERTLVESDCLLGVHDLHRSGALRFRLEDGGPFLAETDAYTVPLWTSLRELEHASLQLESAAVDSAKADQYLRMLLAPGASLGGSRPKAGVLDAHGQLWIGKFPSRRDGHDVGAWEMVLHKLARRAEVEVPEAELRRFSGAHCTFLARRFDRAGNGRRVHFASAMTLLGRSDGDDAHSGASYLEMAELLVRGGASTEVDLRQLWRRIVFNMCVSNADDHLRNHGFLLQPGRGWRLAPAYDMNPTPDSDGLHLNVSESDNAQDLELALTVAPYFRTKLAEARTVVAQVRRAVAGWRRVASSLGIAATEQQAMARAFRLSG